MIPAVDRWGAIGPGAAVTYRGVTGILARRYAAGTVHVATADLDRPSRPGPQPAVPTGRRPAREEHEELARLWEQAEEAADQLNSRILQLLENL